MTYPLVFKINTHIPGFFSTDESYSVLWGSWFIKFCHLNHLSIKSTDFIAYPFGVDFYTNKPITYIWFTINYLLSILTTPVFTYNLQVIFSFLLAAVFSYLLVWYLTKDKFASFFSGIAFGFCPYLFVRSWQHLGETYIWVMPFCLLGLFLLREYTSSKVKIFFISGIILTTIGFNFLYMGVALALFFIYLSCYQIKSKSFLAVAYKVYIKNILFLSFIAIIILLPQIYILIKGAFFSSGGLPSAYNPYHRPFEDLFSQSAKPLSYLLPAAVHPVFGRITEFFIGSHLYGMSFTEHTLYLGWTPLILSFVAFRKWRRNRKSPIAGHKSQVTDREDFYLGFFILLAIVAWLFSQPPWWKLGPLKIYLPPFFLYKILPMFRAYCRFGILVMLAVVVMAGFGLKFILDKFNTKKAKLLITSLFCGLVIFEFWNYPPFKVIDVSNIPVVYYWIKEQPKDTVIAEYPLDIIGVNEMYKFYQTKHGKKTINAVTPGTHAHRVAKTITQLSEPKTAGILRWMGVKYVLVHREDYIATGLIDDYEELNKIPQNSGIKFIQSFHSQECPKKDIMCLQKTGPIDVYEIVAKSINPEVK